MSGKCWETVIFSHRLMWANYKIKLAEFGQLDSIIDAAELNCLEWTSLVVSVGFVQAFDWQMVPVGQPIVSSYP